MSKLEKIIESIKEQSLTEEERRELQKFTQEHYLESIGLNENNTRQLQIGLNRDQVEDELDRKLTDDEWKSLSNYVKLENNDGLYQNMRSDLSDQVCDWLYSD